MGDAVSRKYSPVLRRLSIEHCWNDARWEEDNDFNGLLQFRGECGPVLWPIVKSANKLD